jgi:hypothetical protein
MTYFATLESMKRFIIGILPHGPMEDCKYQVNEVLERKASEKTDRNAV